MKRLCWVFAGLVAAIAAGRLPAGDTPSADHKLAPLERFRLIINLDERDIRFVAAGQKGSVMLAGLR